MAQKSGKSGNQQSNKSVIDLTEDEEDVWGYGKKRKRDIIQRLSGKKSGVNTSESSFQRKKQMKIVKNVQRSPAKSPMKQKPINECFPSPQKKNSGHCPFCQMPFVCLQHLSPRAHTMECMDLPLLSSQECSLGLDCHSLDMAHYRNKRHTLLASKRAGTQSKELFIEEERNKEHSNITQENSSTEFRQNPKRLSAPQDSDATKPHDTEEASGDQTQLVETENAGCNEPLEINTLHATSTLESQALSKPAANNVAVIDDYVDDTLMAELNSSFASDQPPSISSSDVKLTESLPIIKTIHKTGNQTSLLSFFQPKNRKTLIQKSKTSSVNSAPIPSSSISSNSAKNDWVPNYKKQCPFYKKIPETSFTVDAFNYGIIPGCRAYFLSHFHYDHYGGLTKKFRQQLYCYKVTGNLVEKKLRVSSQFVHKLEMNKLYVIHGVEVTLLDANHCPGSVLFLFGLPDGRKILHTGDFRASVSMESYPELKGIKIWQLYLDTTYCNPSYAFPAQDDVVRYAVKLAEEYKFQHPNGLIVVGSYSIGKERIFLAIAESLRSKICVTRDKQVTMQCLEDDHIMAMITRDSSAGVHVLPMQHLKYDNLVNYLDGLKPRFDSVLAVLPTGWTHSERNIGLDGIRPKCQRGSVTIYGLPYSEHSSFSELKQFVQFIRPTQILPTVNNGSAESRKKMDAIFNCWLSEEASSPSKRLRQSGIHQWMT